MTKAYLEKVLNLKLSNNTIIFSFPGIGIGNIYPELSGCTLEVHEMENIAQMYHKQDIDFIGISTSTLPSYSAYIKYLHIENNIKLFKYTNKNNNIFVDRFTLLIQNNEVIKKNIDNVKNNSIIVKEWIKKIQKPRS